jgi:hypothetical protein
MNHDRLRRVRAYFLAATTTLEQIPAPVPPDPEPMLGPPPGWDGPTIETGALYRAYGQLPADVQARASGSHALCETVLAWQQGAAERALLARTMLMDDVVYGTELGQHMDALARLPAVQAYQALMMGGADDEDDDDDQDEGEDEDGELLANVRRELRQYVDGLQGAAAAPEPVRRGAGQRMVRAWAASATVAAAVCALLLIWQHAAVPAPAAATIHPINQSIQAGDMTAIVNYTQRTDDATEVHVHVINFGSEPAPAQLSLGEDDSAPSVEAAAGPPAEPNMVPARSAQHRVLRVRTDRARKKPVDFYFQRTLSVLKIEQ